MVVIALYVSSSKGKSQALKSVIQEFIDVARHLQNSNQKEKDMYHYFR